MLFKIYGTEPLPGQMFNPSLWSCEDFYVSGMQYYMKPEISNGKLNAFKKVVIPC